MTNEEVIEVLYNNNYSKWSMSKKAIELYKFKNNLNEFELDFCCRNDPNLVQIYKDEIKGKMNFPSDTAEDNDLVIDLADVGL